MTKEIEDNRTTGSLIERLKNAPKAKWIKFTIVTILYLAFTVWVGNFWLCLGVLFIVDIYLTRFIPWGCWKRSKNPAIRKTMEWVDAIVFALVAVYLINTFFFQNYKIPTPSLEKTLLVGDYLFVSKLSYGPRVPNTPLSFPLAQHTMPITGTKSYIEWPQWPYKRLAGLGKVKRNDIVVFNFPAGDTVATYVTNPDYHELVYRNGWDVVNKNKSVFGDIVYRPVDRRENFVKRAVGMPGDKLQIIDNNLFINDVRAEDPKNLQYNMFLRTTGGYLDEKTFRELGISKDDRLLVNNERNAEAIFAALGVHRNENGTFNPVYRVPLTSNAYEKASNNPQIIEMIPEPGGWGEQIYPIGFDDKWTRCNYGPIWIPKKGESIELTPDNIRIYERAIRNYEGNALEIKDGKAYINGEEAKSYTFKMDYYFMMGDNRDNSADSRAWGFVPEDHIVGKPLFVWLSIDKDRDWFDGRIRFDRFFKCVTED